MADQQLVGNVPDVYLRINTGVQILMFPKRVRRQTRKVRVIPLQTVK